MMNKSRTPYHYKSTLPRTAQERMMAAGGVAALVAITAGAFAAVIPRDASGEQTQTSLEKHIENRFADLSKQIEDSGVSQLSGTGYNLNLTTDHPVRPHDAVSSDISGGALNVVTPTGYSFKLGNDDNVRGDWYLTVQYGPDAQILAYETGSVERHGDAQNYQPIDQPTFDILMQDADRAVHDALTNAPAENFVQPKL